MADFETDKIARWATDLQSIAQAGLFYGHDEFDKERYEKIRAISAEMMTERTELPQEKIVDLFCAESGYQTPKIDTRAAIFADEKILLVREKSGNWSLPGGWCEYNLSPVENTVKEAKEEAGLDVTVARLIAVQTRSRHNRPPYPYEVVKLFFLCESKGGAFRPNNETIESAYFAADNLPSLAEEKCTAEQVRLCFSALADENWQAQFD